MIPLFHLLPGATGTVGAVRGDAALCLRLAAMGFRIGQRIRMVRKGVFAGPLHVRLGTTDVILRRSHAGYIEVIR